MMRGVRALVVTTVLLITVVPCTLCQEIGSALKRLGDALIDWDERED